MKSVLFAILSLLLLSASAQEPIPVGEMTAASGIPSFCSSSLDIINAEIMTLWDNREFNTTINCLAFGRERMLETGIVSVFRLDGTPSARYTLRCQGNALTATQSPQPVSRRDMRNRPYRACVECEDATAAADICPNPCPVECDRCAQFLPEGILCTDCVRYHLLNSYPRGALLTAEQIETEREDLEEAGQEEICLDNPEVDPEDATMFTCIDECPDGGNFFEPAGIDNVCYACGIEYCVECERSEADQGGRDECTACLADTVLFDGACYSCPDALIARTAILQEAEEREEQAVQRRRQIELAVALPIVSVLVIVFFLAMSVYAHHRYPHHGLSGHHNHDVADKPNLFSTESTHTQSHSSRADLVDADWQGRPSVRQI